MNDRRGFTLIELLIVVSIIGLLASIAIPKLDRARAQARASEIAGAMRAIRIGATIYFDSAGRWPPSASAGTAPASLRGYLPATKVFSGNGWTLQWRRVSVVGGGSQGRLVAQLSDPLLCTPLSNMVGGASSTVSVSCGRRNGRVTVRIDR